MVRPLGQFDGIVGAHLYAKNALRFQQSLERMSSGKQINRGSDNPSGLIASEHLRAMLAAIDAESRSLERTVHVTSTADGVLEGVSSMLVAAKGIAIAREGALTDEERAAYDMEWNSIRNSIDRLLGGASFNGKELFSGDPLNLQAAGESLTVYNMSASGLNLGPEIKDAAIEAALSKVNKVRAEIGSFAKYTIGGRLESLRVEFENLAAANSKIADTDYAAETSEMIRSRLMALMSLRSLVLGKDTNRNVLRLLA